MKIKSLASWLTLISILVAFVGCRKDGNMPNDSAILELSVTALDFKNTGGTQQIEVITDQEEWIADTGADWISPIKDGNNIKVVVEPNRDGRPRQGRISVHAGDRHAQVIVKQVASEIVLKPQHSELHFTKAGGTIDISFATNVKEVQIEVDETLKEWLTVDYVSGSHMISFNAQPNTGSAPRVGKIYLKATVTDFVEISIHQACTPKYILPYLDRRSTRFADINRFEIARGAALAYTPGVLPKNGSVEINPFYIYTADCEAFVQINYLISPENKDYYTNAILLANEAKHLKDPSFDLFMKENGFEKEVVKDQIEYHHKSYPYYAYINIDESKNIYALNFEYEPRQVEPQETFKTVPMSERLDWLQFKDEEIQGKTYDEVKAVYDAEGLALPKPNKNGYTRADYSENNPETRLFDGFWFRLPKFGKTDQYTHKLYYMRRVYRDTTKAFYVVNDKAYITDEFKTFMKEAGYIYLGMDADQIFHRFGNLDTNTRYDVGYVIISGEGDGKPLLDIRVGRTDLSVFKPKE